MKTMKLMLLLSLCGPGLQAYAQQPAQDSDPEANAENLERVQRGGKISPRQKAELAKAAKSEGNLQASSDFLLSNSTKQGVLTLPSGVQYKILKTGAGKRPTQTSAVRCNYVGMLADGTAFDKYQDKSPAALRVEGLVPGLQQAVKLMPAGSKWEVVVPSDLGYGDQGNRNVAPNAVLIYVIEILSIV